MWILSFFREGEIEIPASFEERALFSMNAPIVVDGIIYPESQLLVLAPGRGIRLLAENGARVLVFGGEPLDGPRHLWWNFVSTSVERIEQAKDDRESGLFPGVPEEVEFIPLPRS